LNRDAVDALASHLRFGYRKLGAVQAVAQNDDVLLDRVVLAFLDLLRGQRQLKRRRAIDRDLTQGEIAVVAEYGGLALGEAVGVTDSTRTTFGAVIRLDVLIRDAALRSDARKSCS